MYYPIWPSYLHTRAVAENGSVQWICITSLLKLLLDPFLLRAGVALDLSPSLQRNLRFKLCIWSYCSMWACFSMCSYVWSMMSSYLICWIFMSFYYIGSAQHLALEKFEEMGREVTWAHSKCGSNKVVCFAFISFDYVANLLWPDMRDTAHMAAHDPCRWRFSCRLWRHGSDLLWEGSTPQTSYIMGTHLSWCILLIWICFSAPWLCIAHVLNSALFGEGGLGFSGSVIFTTAFSTGASFERNAEVWEQYGCCAFFLACLA